MGRLQAEELDATLSDPRQWLPRGAGAQNGSALARFAAGITGSMRSRDPGPGVRARPSRQARFESAADDFPSYVARASPPRRGGGGNGFAWEGFGPSQHPKPSQHGGGTVRAEGASEGEGGEGGARARVPQPQFRRADDDDAYEIDDEPSPPRAGGGGGADSEGGIGLGAVVAERDDADEVGELGEGGG